jgi:hypothetical protein
MKHFDHIKENIEQYEVIFFNIIKKISKNFYENIKYKFSNQKIIKERWVLKDFQVIEDYLKFTIRDLYRKKTYDINITILKDHEKKIYNSLNEEIKENDYNKVKLEKDVKYNFDFCINNLKTVFRLNSPRYKIDPSDYKKIINFYKNYIKIKEAIEKIIFIKSKKLKKRDEIIAMTNEPIDIENPDW